MPVFLCVLIDPSYPIGIKELMTFSLLTEIEKTFMVQAWQKDRPLKILIQRFLYVRS